MKKINLLSGLIVLLAQAMISCKKDNPAPVASNTDLISKTWKLTAETINTQDVYNVIDVCERDNKFIYAKNGVYTEDEGTTKCSQTDSQTVETGTWSLLENNTMLKLVTPSGTTVVAINQLTATTLKYTHTDNTGGNMITVVSTFTAQ